MKAGWNRPEGTGAEVIAVEVHPKQPNMYRVAVRLDAAGGAGDPNCAQAAPSDWREEVDALLEEASALQGAAAAEAAEIVTIHEDTLVGMRLLKGRRLTAEEWNILRQEEAIEEAYRVALSMLERKARTSRELSDLLKRKGFAAAVIRSCLERLVSRRLLDDAAYARRFAEQRVAVQRKGSRWVRQELLHRGIAKEDAEQALRQIDESVETASAVALARKKWPQTKGEMRERKMKLAAYLLRRGFPNRIVRAAVDQVTAESEEREDSGIGGDD